MVQYYICYSYYTGLSPVRTPVNRECFWIVNPCINYNTGVKSSDKMHALINFLQELRTEF